MWNLTGNNAVTKPGRSLLPALIILFLVSYGLLTMLVVEQGRTIDSQRGLIQMLFSDSVELTGLRGKENQRKQAEAQARAPKKSPPAQAAPQTPQMQSPSSNPPQVGAKSQSTSKLARPLPQKPPKATADQDDERRILVSI